MTPDEETPPDPAPSEDLGRSYEAILGRQDWSIDVPEAGPEPPPEPPAEAPPPPARAAPPAEETPPSPARIVEAILFTGGAPLTAVQACEIIRGLTPESFQQAVDALNQE